MSDEEYETDTSSVVKGRAMSIPPGTSPEYPVLICVVEDADTEELRWIGWNLISFEEKEPEKNERADQ